MAKEIIQRVDRKKGRDRDEAVDFPEVSPDQELVVYLVETLARRVMFGDHFFELSVARAELEHLVDELRVFYVVLVSADQVVDRVELVQLTRLFKQEQRNESGQQAVNDNQEKSPSMNNI